MSEGRKVNLENNLVEGDTSIIEEFCFEYFQNCEFTSDYKIEAVCPDGLLKLFCGYFKGKYGIIEIDLVGLYPGEIEEIEYSVIAVLQDRLRTLPKKKGLENFNY
ncbi:MAG: hypothetical protein ACFFDS_07000, partial [Candidatus Thorarchaeota archaeon]